MKRALATLALAIASTPAVAQAPAAPAVAGALIGPVLFVSDLARALHFYVDGFGMKLATQMGPPERRENILSFGGDPSAPGIILLADMRSAAPAAIEHGHGYELTVLRMADLSATSAKLQSAGFSPSPIRDVAQGYRMMTVTDPDGYRYELVEHRSARSITP